MPFFTGSNEVIQERLHNISTLIRPSIVTVFNRLGTRGSKLNAVCSAVLITIEERYFAVTAKHAIKHITGGHFIIGTPSAGTSLLGKDIFTEDCGDGDPYDLWIWELTDEDRYHLPNVEYLTTSNIAIGPQEGYQAGSPFIALGFPLSWVTKENEDIPLPKCLYFGSRALPWDKYGKFSPSTHIAIEYSHLGETEQGLRKTPHPRGMSGGGLFSIISRDGGKTFLPMLSGILIEYHSSHERLIAIRTWCMINGIQNLINR
jgi:hypothetical protein